MIKRGRNKGVVFELYDFTDRLHNNRYWVREQELNRHTCIREFAVICLERDGIRADIRFQVRVLVQRLKQSWSGFRQRSAQKSAVASPANPERKFANIWQPLVHVLVSEAILELLLKHVAKDGSAHIDQVSWLRNLWVLAGGNDFEGERFPDRPIATVVRVSIHLAIQCAGVFPKRFCRIRENH